MDSSGSRSRDVPRIGGCQPKISISSPSDSSASSNYRRRRKHGRSSRRSSRKGGTKRSNRRSRKYRSKAEQNSSTILRGKSDEDRSWHSRESSISSEHDCKRKRAKNESLGGTSKSRREEKKKRKRKDRKGRKSGESRRRDQKRSRSPSRKGSDGYDSKLLPAQNSTQNGTTIKNTDVVNIAKFAAKEKETTKEEKHLAKRMVPMTKDEYDANQAKIREIYDPGSGRMRLVRGSGEIIERIVSRSEHQRINQIATAGDGASFLRGISSRLSSFNKGIRR